jgi:hypothetical protein
MRKIFTLSPSLAKKIEKLSDRWGVSQAEVMRRTITVGVFFAEEVEKGNTLLKEATEGTVKLVFPELELLKAKDK